MHLSRIAAAACVVLVGCSGTVASSTTVPVAPSTSIASTTTSTTAPPESTTTTVSQDAIDIRAALDGYLAALAAGDGAAAVQFVDSGTIGLMRDLLLLAAAPVSIEEMDFVDAVVVLRLRHRFPASALDELDAETLFVEAIEGQLLIGSPGPDITFEQINIIDDEAAGEVGGSPAMWFSKEDGVWKIALGRTYEEYSSVLSVTLEQSARELAGPEASLSDALLALVESVEGAEIDPEALLGPLP